jgi:hypothetical protein
MAMTAPGIGGVALAAALLAAPALAQNAPTHRVA